MPNNVRTQNDATWVSGYAVSQADLEDLSRKIFEAVNGTTGGAYAAFPNAGWAFGGSGFKVTGPVRLTRGGKITITAGSYKLRNGTWPKISSTHADKNREIVQSTSIFHSPHPHLWSTRHPYGGVGSVALACRETASRTIERAEFYAQLRVHDGATLKNVQFWYRVALPRQHAPIAMPKFRVLAVPKDPVVQAALPLKKTTIGDGFASPELVTSAAVWYAEGQVQTFDYVCDQNHVIDVEKFHYLVHVIDEQGASTPDDDFDGIRFVERKPDVAAVGTNALTTNGDLTVDAVVVGGLFATRRVLIVDSDAVLRTGQANSKSTKNGIYNHVEAAPWTRSMDLDEPSDFTPNWIVRVGGFGEVNRLSVWQCDHPSSLQRIYPAALMSTSVDDDATRIRIRPAEPRGNYYHSIVSTFELADLRFQ